MIDKLRYFTRIFAPQPTVPLGRWRLKHNVSECDTYLKNCYGEPGYPNMLKDQWIKILEDKNYSETNSNNHSNNV